MTINPALYSSESGEWATPQDFFDKLNQEFHFTLDAAARPETAKCADYLTQEQDALSPNTRWEGVVFCNPPYGKEIGLWFTKAREEAAKGATVVMLAHARTDTRWWHQHVQGIADEVRFVKGRLKFVSKDGVKSSAPFP